MHSVRYRSSGLEAVGSILPRVLQEIARQFELDHARHAAAVRLRRRESQQRKYPGDAYVAERDS